MWRCPEPKWKDDAYGHKDRALYVGGLHVGTIMSGPTNHHFGEWRAWFMSDEDGNELGWFPTEDAAKEALMDALCRAFSD